MSGGPNHVLLSSTPIYNPLSMAFLSHLSHIVVTLTKPFIIEGRLVPPRYNAMHCHWLFNPTEHIDHGSICHIWAYKGTERYKVFVSSGAAVGDEQGSGSTGNETDLWFLLR
jgi:hypothetical protein